MRRISRISLEMRADSPPVSTISPSRFRPHRNLDSLAPACEVGPTMNPNVLKVLAACVLAVAASLEAQAVLPPGASGAIGGFVTFLIGVFHPNPKAK